MININEVIYGLKFTKAMITFNPSTGEDIEPENLNKDDKITYDACVGAVALLKEQEAVKCPTDYDNELTRHVLFTARQHVEDCLNKAKVRYGGETVEYLMFAKGIRDACWAIDELINAHSEGTEQNNE